MGLIPHECDKDVAPVPLDGISLARASSTMEPRRTKPLKPPRFPLSLETMDGSTALSATQDHDVIRQWADRLQAQPATGESSPSGPATIDVRDGGAGIRFNFPGAARFRPISWSEWFEHFERHHLVFVYAEPRAEEVASRAYELWQRRGGGDGHDRDDWFRAEEQVRTTRAGGTQDSSYRLMKADDDET
jgi:hypothetical protein